MAKSYITMVDEWFDSNVYIFEDAHPDVPLTVPMAKQRTMIWTAIPKIRMVPQKFP
jgi:hypothetical protein